MAPRRYFFRATDGSLIGPVNLNAVAEMIQAGKVKANTPISLDGHDFKPMKSVSELATLLSVDVDLPDASEGDDLFEAPPTYSGELMQVSLPKLMYHFTAARANGRLLLVNQSVRKELYLLNGKPVAANSNLERDRLSQHLVRNGVIDALQMEKILASLKGDEAHLGDFLIQRRIIQPHLLFEHLKTQLLEKIYEVFSWRVGNYAFYDGKEFKGTLLPLNLNPWEVIAEGVRMGYDLTELRQLLEPLRNRILVSRDNEHTHVSKLVLHPRELKIFKSISSGRTLGGILEQLGGKDSADKIVLSMIYMGIELELVGIGDEIIADPNDLNGDLAPEDDWDAMLHDGFAAEPEASQIDPAGPIQATGVMSRQEQNLLEVMNEIKEKNFFARLDIELSATSAQVSKAFVTVARAYHPDNVPSDAPNRVRDLMSDIFALLNDAHQTLSDDSRRKDYAEAIEAGFEDGQVDVGNIMEAEMLFQKGEVQSSNGKFAEAVQTFQEAIDLNPDEGEFLVYRGYCTYFAASKPDSRSTERCIQEITQGLKMRDNNVAVGYLFLGRIYKAMGDMEKAEKNFRKTLSLERNNLEASRELRLLNMRGKKKGLFKKK